MVATVGKQFTFHAAHRLPHHDGQCRDLHGHSYVLEVAVTGPVKTADGESPDEGMVLDFGEIKDIYREHIEPQVEHKYLNKTLVGLVPNTEAAAEVDVTAFGDAEPKRMPIELVPEPLTTCENVARWILRVFEDQLSPYDSDPLRPISIKVKLWETPTSYAEVGKTPWRSE